MAEGDLALRGLSSAVAAGDAGTQEGVSVTMDVEREQEFVVALRRNVAKGADSSDMVRDAAMLVIRAQVEALLRVHEHLMLAHRRLSAAPPLHLIGAATPDFRAEKAEGVLLALSYVEDELRMLDDQRRVVDRS